MSRDRKLSAVPVNEDTVQCLFFSVELGSDIALWEELCQQINTTIKTLTGDYIWQRDVFQVFLPLSSLTDTGVPIHLHSNVCFGDNIEDEWFIVYLALEISRQFKHLIIQITDNDGDFLLIEAANCLQTWANPDNTENRVFIHYNHLHIITPEVATLQESLDIQTALSIIHQSPETTKAPYDIEQTIRSRVGEYPENFMKNIHMAVVNVPINLAALLLLKPSLIAPIVNAYCNHDAIDVKNCNNIGYSECVTIKVKFTKYLYAMLMHSKLINCIKHISPKSDKKNVLGLKLTCGFQMILNKSSIDLFSSKEYQTFLNNLTKSGYFKNNIKGSQAYNHLLENAQENFKLNECPRNLELAHTISQIMLSDDYIELKKSLVDKQMMEHDYTEDNDDWLNIKPEQLNELLLMRYGKETKFKQNDVLSADVVTAELSSFLKQTSDFEGIEQDHNEKSDDNEIEFESDQFVSCIEKMLNILSTGNAESEDSDDYLTDIDNFEDENDVCETELKAKLHQDQSENLRDTNTMYSNIIQSMKEEKASTGPASNLLRTMGLNKPEFFDTEDDVD